MKLKQLEIIKKRHAENQSYGKTNKPDNCNCEIKLALVSEHPPRLRTSKEIIEAAKKTIVCEGRYSNSEIKLSDIFVAPANGKLAAWKKSEDDRLARVAKYNALANELIERAELDDESDCQVVSAELSALAKRFSLKA